MTCEAGIPSRGPRKPAESPPRRRPDRRRLCPTTRVCAAADGKPTCCDGLSPRLVAAALGGSRRGRSTSTLNADQRGGLRASPAWKPRSTEPAADVVPLGADRSGFWFRLDCNDEDVAWNRLAVDGSLHWRALLFDPGSGPLPRRCARSYDMPPGTRATVVVAPRPVNQPTIGTLVKGDPSALRHRAPVHQLATTGAGSHSGAALSHRNRSVAARLRGAAVLAAASRGCTTALLLLRNRQRARGSAPGDPRSDRPHPARDHRGHLRQRRPRRRSFSRVQPTKLARHRCTRPPSATPAAPRAVLFRVRGPGAFDVGRLTSEAQRVGPIASGSWRCSSSSRSGGLDVDAHLHQSVVADQARTRRVLEELRPRPGPRRSDSRSRSPSSTLIGQGEPSSSAPPGPGRRRKSSTSACQLLDGPEAGRSSRSRAGYGDAGRICRCQTGASCANVIVPVAHDRGKAGVFILPVLYGGPGHGHLRPAHRLREMIQPRFDARRARRCSWCGSSWAC
jgi:hypothetical protein